MKRINFKFSLMTLALWSASQAMAATPAKELGENLVGEVCELKSRDDLTPEQGLPPDARIFCGEKQAGNLVYSKFLSSSNKDINQLKLQLLAQYKSGRAANLVNSRMKCGEPGWLMSAADTPIAMFPCQLKSGGWQHMVVVYANKEILEVSDGAPTMATSLLRMTGLKEEDVLKATTPERLQTLWGKPVILASASDLAQFKQLVNDGRNANNLSKFPQAEESFRKALELQTKFLGPNNTAIADTLLDLALNVSNQGKTDEAQALFRRAEPIVQKSPFEADRARFAFYQGLEAANRGDTENGLKFAREATGAWRKLATGDSVQGLLSGGASSGNTAEKGELILALNFEAQMSLRNEDLVSANALASEALLLLTQTEGLPKWWRADVMLTLGEVSIAQGRLSAAETYFNSALVTRQRIFGDGASTLPVLTALGKAYQAESMNTSAIITYRDAFKLAKSLNLPGEVFSKEQLVPFGAAISDYADTLKDETSRQGLYAEAFDAFQMARSGVVDKTIAKAQARMANNDPAISDIIERLQNLQRKRDGAKAELALEQALPDEERSGEVEARLQLDIRTGDQNIRKLQQELNVKFPAYSQLANPKPLQLIEIRKRLGDKEALVSFIIGRKQSFIQVTRRGGNYVARVKESETSLNDTVKALRRALEIQGGAINEFDLARSHELYQSLFSSVERYLKDVDHLIVASAGPLASLPFGLLVTKPPKNGDYSEAHWLTQQFAISHVPSMQAFYTLRGNVPNRLPPYPLLAFGDPVLQGQTDKKGETGALEKAATGCRPDGPFSGDVLRALAPLPETTGEIKTVSQILGQNKSSVFLREQASEDNLRKQNLSDYRILYFATHGLLPGELRCQAEPGLVLTPPNGQSSDKASDGLLEASEIAGMKLNADMVVLSACNTAGGGGKFGGEALSGLAESFFFAGARSLVVSHWQVPSAATAALLSGMFTKLGPELKGGSSAALRTSQMNLITQKKSAHPFFWAAFVVVGDGMAASSSALLSAQSGQETKK